MAQYISKAAVMAEIKKEIKHIYAGREYVGIPLNEECIVRGIQKVEDIIDTLEVKSVDLNEEVKKYLFNCIDNDGLKPINIAKHFFELGLRSTITEEDCKLIWNIGDEIPNMLEEEFFKELLKRYKAQKREEI